MNDADIYIFPVDKFGNRYGSGPIEGASVGQFTFALNDLGSAQISFHPLAKNANHVKCIKREIQIWFDDELAWWGVPVRPSGDLNQVTIECEGLFSHLTRRLIDRASALYTSIDQLNIGWGLMTYAQNEAVQANRDLNIDAATFAPSGVPRSRNYSREQHPIIWDLLKEFPTLDNGFDFDITYDGTGQRLWTPYYPRKGTLKSNLRIFIDVDNDSGVSNFTYAEDGVQVANDVYVNGGSNGDVKFEGHYEDTAASAEYGVQQAAISEGSQNDVTWLLDRAKKEVANRKRPIITPDITAARVPRDWFELIETGDQIPVFVNYGFYQIDANYRIGSKTWTPQGVQVTFSEQAAA